MATTAAPPTPSTAKPDGASKFVRPAAVAGSFYPDDPALLSNDLDRMLEQAGAQIPANGTAPSSEPAPVALIAPHAGYVYSGPIAASAYVRLANSKPSFRRVVIIGPAHRVGFVGIGVSSATAFATPFGDIPQDHDAINRMRKLPFVHIRDDAHQDEHSIEVHLPFLQKVLGRFNLIALVAGQASPEEVATVLDPFFDDPETLIVISTDLSHFLDYETARALDRKTADAITALDADGISDDGACGRIPVRGLLAVGQRRHFSVRLVDIRNSGDTAGTRDRVVGYASFVVERNERRSLIQETDQTALLDIAEQSVRGGIMDGKTMPIDPTRFSISLQEQGASFITLTRNGNLRGCIGTLAAHRSLVKDVAANAFASAFSDPRFSPITESDWPELAISISVLSPAEAFSVTDEEDLLRTLRPGIDGLILSDGKRRATFLPQVWEQLKTPEVFVRHLKQKAGLAGDFWSDQMTFLRYTTFNFGRPFGPFSAN